MRRPRDLVSRSTMAFQHAVIQMVIHTYIRRWSRKNAKYRSAYRSK